MKRNRRDAPPPNETQLSFAAQSGSATRPPPPNTTNSQSNTWNGLTYQCPFHIQSQPATRNESTPNQNVTQSPYQAYVQGQPLLSQVPSYPPPPCESIGPLTNNASGCSTASSAASSHLRASSASLSYNIGRLNNSSKYQGRKNLEPSAAASPATNKAKGWLRGFSPAKNSRGDDELRSAARQVAAATPVYTLPAPPKVLTMILIEQIPSVVRSGDIRTEMQPFGLDRVTTHSREFKQSTAVFPALHEIVQYAKVILDSRKNAEKGVARLYRGGIKSRADGQRYAVTAKILDGIDWSL